MKRPTAETIFRTVVFAGAMLGAPACRKNSAATTPNAANTSPSTTDPAVTGDDKPKETTSADPCAGGEADPCSGERPRGTDEDGGGGEGRGFILS